MESDRRSLRSMSAWILAACVVGSSTNRVAAQDTPPQRSPELIAALAVVMAETTPDAADKLLAAALKAMPASAIARFRLANRDYFGRRFEAAADHYRRVDSPALAAHGATWHAHSLAGAGLWSQARDAYSERGAHHLPIAWRPWCIPGSSNATADAGIVHWRRLAREAKDTAVPWWLLGNCYASSDRAAEALPAYEKALAIDADWVPAVVAAAMAEDAMGNAGAAVRRLANLSDRTGDMLLSWARFVVFDHAGQPKAALEALDELVTLAPHAVDAGTLIDGALAAARAGDAKAGMRYLDHAVLRVSLYPRMILGPNDDEALRTLARQDLTRGPAAPLWRYALASALLGKADTALQELESGNVLAFGALTSALERFPVSPSIQEALSTLRSRIAPSGEPGSPAAMAEMMAASMRAAVVPVKMRACLELEPVLATHPGFASARVLHALALRQCGELLQDKEGMRRAATELEALVDAHPQATGPRLLLASWSPLDVRETLLDGVDARDDGTLRVLVQRANLAAEIGDDRACIQHLLRIVHEHSTYWDTLESLGMALVRARDSDAAKTCFAFAHRNAGTAPGLIAHARLRAAAGQGSVIELLIDAWRAAPGGSAAEDEARSLLGEQANLRQYTCQRCGGGGAVSNVSGSTYVTTNRVACDQCRGLGLWHPKVR